MRLDKALRVRSTRSTLVFRWCGERSGWRRESGRERSMGSLRRNVYSALSAGILLIQTATHVSGQTPRHEWLKRCGMVYIGRVVSGADVAFADVTRSAQSVVVSVHELLQSPAAVTVGDESQSKV